MSTDWADTLDARSRSLHRQPIGPDYSLADNTGSLVALLESRRAKKGATDVLAEFGTGQVLWSMMWFFFFFVYIWVVIAILTDIFRDHEMGGVAKAIWIIALVVVPLVTGIVYLIVRGGGMSERAMKQA